MRRIAIILPILASLALSKMAMAGLVTWEFAGEITNVVDDADRLGGTVVVGSLFSGSFTFDLSTTDSDPSDEIGLFVDAIVEFTGSVGSFGFAGPSGLLNSIEVRNRINDGYFAETEVELAEEVFILQLNFVTGPDTTFPSDALPSTPPDPDVFSFTRFRIFNGSEVSPFSLSGSISSVVPEPGSITLLLLGSLILTRRKRSTRCRRHIGSGVSIFCLIVVVTTAGTASAGFVTWEFAGEITNVVDDADRLGGAVVVGSPFSGSFTFDLSTPDSDPSDEIGLYVDAIVDISGEVDGIAFVQAGIVDNFISIRNRISDSFLSQSTVIMLGESFVFEFGLGTGPGSTFSSDALPFDPPNPQLFDFSSFGIFNGSEKSRFSLRGEVQHIIPEPGTVALLLGGMLFMPIVGARRRLKEEKVSGRIIYVVEDYGRFRACDDRCMAVQAA